MISECCLSRTVVEIYEHTDCRIPTRTDWKSLKVQWRNKNTGTWCSCREPLSGKHNTTYVGINIVMTAKNCTCTCVTVKLVWTQGQTCLKNVTFYTVCCWQDSYNFVIDVQFALLLEQCRKEIPNCNFYKNLHVTDGGQCADKKSSICVLLFIVLFLSRLKITRSTHHINCRGALCACLCHLQSSKTKFTIFSYRSDHYQCPSRTKVKACQPNSLFIKNLIFKGKNMSSNHFSH